MSSICGHQIRLSIFGQSHAPAIGMTLDGVPAGLPVDFKALQEFINRRAPGQNALSTSRKEADIPEFLSGIVDGYTCGAPITAIIRNTNTRSGDYANLHDIPRPGHADLTAQLKYRGFQDVAGGGHFSGRLTAPLCIAGGLCKQWLEQAGIQISAHIQSIGSICDDHLDWVNPDLNSIHKDFPVVNETKGLEMKEAIAAAKSLGDSIGGVIECIATGIPAGYGDPMFDGMENRIAQIIFAIPAVKGLSFGSGFYGTTMFGSQNNDPLYFNDGRVLAKTNNAGGILGGITNGMPLVFQVAVKPTPSISVPQESVSFSRMDAEQLVVKGRHDPCIVPRAVPVVEAATALAISDVYFVGR